MGMGIGIRLIISVIIALSPVLAYAHPGKTDVRGGHKCWKGCRQWELYHGEYHLHDKDFRPIRLNQPSPAKPPDVPESIPEQQPSQELQPEKLPEPPQPLPAPVKRPAAAVNPPPTEEALFPLEPYAMALLAILLMLLVVLLFLRKKRGDSRGASHD